MRKPRALRQIGPDAETDANKTYQDRPSTEVTERTPHDAGLLQRGFMVLDALIREEHPLTSAEIAALVDLNPSTAHRLLQALIQVGYVYRDDAKRYSPSIRALFPISLYHPLQVFRRAANDELRELRRRFGMTVALVIFFANRRLVLELVPGNDSLSPYFETELVAPLHATATGRLLLLNLSSEQRRALLGSEPYEARGSQSIKTFDELEREIELTSRRGYALAIDEMVEGLSGVAVPIRAGGRRILGSIGMSGPSHGFDEASIEKAATALKRSSDLFSTASPDLKVVCRFLGL